MHGRSLVVFLSLWFFGPTAHVSSAAPANVLVIMVDDLNDWIGCMGGHPQVKTPHIDRLATRGMLFTNAHVQATFCGPSRISLLSGRMPQTTGCRNFERYEALKTLQNHPPFPLHFRKTGFETFGGGKVFHHGTGDGWVKDSWATIIPSGGNPSPKERMHWPKKVWDWGPWPESDEEMGDFRLAKATATVLERKHDKPFFVVAGFRRPHVPLHVPQKWFSLYPLDEIVLPRVPVEDLGDVPHPAIGLENHAAPKHSKIVDDKLWRSLVQSYLASISFVDHCVGEVMRGLDNGPNRENTIVVLLSDHGFHLGEKQHWAKRTLWEETTRVPLIVTGPTIKAQSQTNKPVGLIDLYPTLCDLTGQPAPDGLEGRSLRPLLKSPQEAWNFPAYTTFNQGDLSVRTENWRYILYPDGTEELYDHGSDPNEWRNLADDEQHSTKKEELAGLAAKWK